MTVNNARFQLLPIGWAQVKLGDVLNVIRGASPRPKGDPQYFGGRIPWIMISDVTREKGKFIVTTKDKVTEEGAKRSRYLRADTLILSNSGTVCIPKILGVDGCIHDGFVAFPDLTECIDISYLYYFFEFIRPQIIKENRQGVTQVNLNTTIVKNIDLCVAPLNEQKRIVAEIEKQFSRLDEALANLHRVKANLKRYKASVLKAAVEGKLTEQWRKEHPDVEPADKLLKRILAERRQKWEEAELAKMRRRGIEPKDNDWKRRYKGASLGDLEDLPVLPIGWVWATLDQMAAAEPNAITDGPFGSNLKTEHYTEHGPRVIRLQNIGYAEFIDEKAHITEEHCARLIKHSARPDDVVIAGLGHPSPRACLVPPRIGKAIVKADCVRFRASPHLKPGYLMYALNSEPTQKGTEKIVHGIGRPRLNLGEIKSILLPVPPKNEQEAIFEEIEHRLSVGLDLLRKVESDISCAERLRQSILKKAFIGKLVPQDPNDEPAKDLLARIRIARDKHEIELERQKKEEKQPVKTPGEPLDSKKRDLIEVLKQAKRSLKPEDVLDRN